MKEALFLLLFVVCTMTYAHPADTYEFHSPEAERRAMALSRELRCPQCQNQNLLESNSPIAQDLRLEVYQRVDSGQTNEAVIQQMTERFGEFVRYNPPFNAVTLFLWGAPGLLLLLAIWMLRRARGRPLAVVVSENSGDSGDRATVRERVNHAIYQAEKSCLGDRYRDSPELAAELEHELAMTHERTVPTAKMSDASRRIVTIPGWCSAYPSYLGLTLVVLALLGTLAGYAYSGRWQAAEQWRNNPDPLLTLQGEELKDAAEQSLENRIRANPRDIDAWGELGQFYVYRERYELALIVYDRIGELEGGMKASTLAAKAAVLYYQAGQTITPEAQQLIDAALAQDPGEVTVLMLLASDHFLHARHSEAIALWQRLLDEGRARVNREMVIQAIQTSRMLER